MSTPRIDLAGRADVPHALRFANWAAEHTPANFALGPEPLDAWLAEFDHRHAMYPWLVARTDDGVVGFAKASPYRARGAYAWTAEVTIYVDEAAQGKGVGKALYGVLIPLLRAQRYVTLLAGITTPHEPSERLHASFGFTRCATFHRVGWKFGRWHDVSFWELPLQAEGTAAEVIRTVQHVWDGRASQAAPPHEIR
jgi:phosphinothricin acetyltransferase